MPKKHIRDYEWSYIFSDDGLKLAAAFQELLGDNVRVEVEQFEIPDELIDDEPDGE